MPQRVFYLERTRPRPVRTFHGDCDENSHTGSREVCSSSIGLFIFFDEKRFRHFHAGLPLAGRAYRDSLQRLVLHKSNVDVICLTTLRCSTWFR